jgi:hypothetical protein
VEIEFSAASSTGLKNVAVLVNIEVSGDLISKPNTFLHYIKGKRQAKKILPVLTYVQGGIVYVK